MRQFVGARVALVPVLSTITVGCREPRTAYSLMSYLATPDRVKVPTCDEAAKLWACGEEHYR